MSTKRKKKLVQVGNFIAEVDVELIYLDEEAWSPYISLEDAYKLDEVREALKQGDIHSALKKAKVYTLTPVAA